MKLGREFQNIFLQDIFYMSDERLYRPYIMALRNQILDRECTAFGGRQECLFQITLQKKAQELSTREISLELIPLKIFLARSFYIFLDI